MSKPILAVVAMTLFALGGLPVPRTVRLDGAETKSNQRERPLAAGKKVFVERCASCHGERGDKPLRVGPPLSRRRLTPEQLSRAVGGRLKDQPEQLRRAVALYIESLVREKYSSN